jgi:type I restriction enzyme R subunit
MTTGVDAQTCKVIVLDANINSMTSSNKLLVEEHESMKNTENSISLFWILEMQPDLFADKDFDGDPIRVKPVSQDEDLSMVVIEEEENTVTVLDEATGEEIKFEKA